MLSLDTNEKTPEKSSSLENILTDKTKNLKSTAKALLDEIETRKHLHQRLVQKIDEEVSEQNSEILNFKSIWPKYDWEKEQEFNKLKGDLEKKVLKLESEKRNEQVECWRDLMLLNKDLMFALREYWDLAKRREALFERTKDLLYPE